MNKCSWACEWLRSWNAGFSLVCCIHKPQSLCSFWRSYSHLSGGAAATYLEVLQSLIWRICSHLSGGAPATYLEELRSLIWRSCGHLSGGAPATYLEELQPLIWRSPSHLSGGAAATYLEELQPLIWRSCGHLSGGASAIYLFQMEIRLTQPSWAGAWTELGKRAPYNGKALECIGDLNWYVYLHFTFLNVFPVILCNPTKAFSPYWYKSANKAPLLTNQSVKRI